MRILAHAKINLDLHILGRRPDGYHELSTIMQGLALADELTVDVETTRAEGEKTAFAEGCPPEACPGGTYRPRITLTVSGADLPADESNLAWKAADAMLREAVRRGLFRADEGWPESASGGAESGQSGVKSVSDSAAASPSASILPRVRIALEKRIPFEAGLGGGSSDAAAVLLALNELLGLDLPLELLAAIGKRLGADVPFCLLVNAGECAAAHCTGIGDFIDPVPAKERACLLVKPALGLSTPEMYRAWDEMGTVATNDFEPIAEYRYPEIRALKDAIRDASQIGDARDGFNGSAARSGDPTACSSALQIQMSGSGPTFFALYESEEAASLAASRLKGRYPVVLLTKTLA